jgi:hypothetical protein
MGKKHLTFYISFYIIVPVHFEGDAISVGKKIIVANMVALNSKKG